MSTDQRTKRFNSIYTIENCSHLHLRNCVSFSLYVSNFHSIYTPSPQQQHPQKHNPLITWSPAHVISRSHPPHDQSQLQPLPSADHQLRHFVVIHHFVVLRRRSRRRTFAAPQQTTGPPPAARRGRRWFGGGNGGGVVECHWHVDVRLRRRRPHVKWHHERRAIREGKPVLWKHQPVHAPDFVVLQGTVVYFSNRQPPSFNVRTLNLDCVRF